jgi:hypothetical protein
MRVYPFPYAPQQVILLPAHRLVFTFQEFLIKEGIKIISNCILTTNTPLVGPPGAGKRMNSK